MNMMQSIPRDCWSEIMKHMSTFNIRCLVQTNKEMSESIIREELVKRIDEKKLFIIYKGLESEQMKYDLYISLGKKFGCNWSFGEGDVYLTPNTWENIISENHNKNRDVINYIKDYGHYECVICNKRYCNWKRRAVHRKGKKHIKKLKEHNWDLLNLCYYITPTEPEIKFSPKIRRETNFLNELDTFKENRHGCGIWWKVPIL